VPLSETVPEAENVPLKVPAGPELLGSWSAGNTSVVVIVSEPDARAAPGTNANTPATPTNKTTARARPRATNRPNLRAQLKIIAITPDRRRGGLANHRNNSTNLPDASTLSKQPNNLA
jgi:hypothetical protein